LDSARKDGEFWSGHFALVIQESSHSALAILAFMLIPQVYFNI
jgi:hypothetical protein